MLGSIDGNHKTDGFHMQCGSQEERVGRMDAKDGYYKTLVNAVCERRWSRIWLYIRKDAVSPSPRSMDQSKTIMPTNTKSKV